MEPISISGAPAADFAKEAIKKCRDLGARIMIATAQHERVVNHPYQRRFLSHVGLRTGELVLSRTDQSVFRDGSVKLPMLEHISTWVEKPSDVIFYDDQAGNIRAARHAGVSAVLVNKEGVGITKSEFEEGMEKVGWKPRICVFDIDATLTNERERRVESKETYKKMPAASVDTRAPGSHVRISRYLVPLLIALLIVTIVHVWKRIK